MEKILNNTKRNKKYWLFALFVMWILVWSGYNTGISRVMSQEFPHDLLDLIHGIRAFFPILVGALAVAFLFVKNLAWRKFLFTPLGFLMIYGVVGVFSSIISKNPIDGLYWALMYLSVIFVIQAFLSEENVRENFSYIINLNWIIAVAITIFLIIFFLLQPGAIHSLSFNSFFCGARLYEGLGGVDAGVNTLGMHGTRPTGLGRYAGLAAIVALYWFLSSKTNKKIPFFLLFVFFFLVTLLSKGKTEVIALIAVLIFVFFVSKGFKKILFFILLLTILASLPIVVLDIPCPGENSVVSVPEKTISLEIKLRESTINLSSRLSVWIYAWNSFLSSPLWGHGFYGDKSFTTAHSTILHALMQTGILGAIFYVLAFFWIFITLFKIFKNSNILQKEKNQLIIASSALIFFVVRGLAESMAIYSADWLFVAPIIAYIQHLDQKLRSENKQRKIDFCSLKVDTIKMPEVLDRIDYWIKNESRKCHWIIVTGMHGVAEVSRHADFRYILSQADMWVPDGISLVWIARLKGFNIKERISGTDLMEEIFKKDYNNFLYGDTQEILDAVKNKFSDKNIEIFSPPFRELTKEEDEQIINKINQAKSDILWVGLGLPKQERWIFQHKDRLNVPVVIGVGAAFKFLSGKVKRAPKWIGKIGLEWLWRLVKEPKRVWKRVFIDMPYFFWLVVKDLFS